MPRDVAREVPTDASFSSVAIDHHASSCGILKITNHTLARIFANPKIGDPKGIVGVELNYIDADLNSVYHTANIQTVSVGIGALSPKQDC